MRDERCVTNKRIFYSREDAINALIGAWGRNNYREGGAPVAVYECRDCGQWHWTSQGPMDPLLKAEIDSGNIARQLEANRWNDRLR